MNPTIVKVLTVMGFIFAAISFLMPALQLFILPLEYQIEIIFSRKAFLFNPLTYALLGVLMASLMRFEKSEYVKKWSNRVIIANIIAVIASVMLYIVIPLLVFR